MKRAVAGTLDPVSVVVAPRTSRLAWLDALRGVGAAAVLAEHLLPWVIPSLRPYWFNLGIYGVMVFFLVSGYIIPTSLERRGDVGGFWVGRVFRLYPLYIVVIALVLALSWWLPVREAVPRDLSAAAGHATMLLDVVGVGGVADTMWTLSYEMVFYLLVTALFLAGTHRRSGTIAVVFGVAAVATGLVVVASPLRGAWLAYGSAVVFFAGLVCLITGRYRRTAAAALAVMALALLFLGGRIPWLGVSVLAVMFAGTAIRRWEEGEGTLWPVAATGALVAITPVWARQDVGWWVQPPVWITTIVLAAASFAIAMAVRRRSVPRALVWLGLISYSLYLVHHPLLRLFIEITGDLRWSPLPVQLAMATVFTAAILGASWLTYRYVEQPMNALGTRLRHRR